MKSLKIWILSIVAFAATSNILNAQTTSKELPKLENLEVMEVKVKGVGCSADIKSISESVEKLEGVSQCKVLKKGATTKFQVYRLPSKVSDEAIFNAIEDTPGCTNPNDRPYKVKGR